MAAKKSTKSRSTKHTAKPVKTQPEVVLTRRAKNGLRQRRLNRSQVKKRTRLDHQKKPVPSAWKILARSLKQMYQNKKLFLGILLIYGVLYILFVKGISGNFQLGNLKQQLQDTFGGKLSTLSTGFALYGLLLGSSSNTSTTTSDTAGVYQTVLVVLVSLALIWALRQTFASNKKLRVKDSFYTGMYPLAQFVLVAMVALLELIPALIVTSIYSTIQANGLSVGPAEQIITLIFLVLGLFLSLYWLSGTLFAFYIVTLPKSQPVTSLKAANKLVRFRRMMILRKVAFLPILLLIFSAAILIPLIILLPSLAEILFMIFTISVIAIFHGYYYQLYRSLL